MIIIPAIDILAGEAIRLQQGDFEHITESRGDPLELASEWTKAGAALIHVVDLDGALTGEQKNGSCIAALCESTSTPVEVGGGLRTVDAVAAVFVAGAARAVIGTAALKDKEVLRQLVEMWGERIVVGIDARDGFVATEGWRDTSETLATDFVQDVVELGVRHIIYTDIARDGTLIGPNLSALSAIIEAVDVPIIASGGVGTIAHLHQIKDTGAAGVIVGRALYTGAIALDTAIREVQDANEAHHSLP